MPIPSSKAGVGHDGFLAYWTAHPPHASDHHPKPHHVAPPNCVTPSRKLNDNAPWPNGVAARSCRMSENPQAVKFADNQHYVNWNLAYSQGMHNSRPDNRLRRYGQAGGKEDLGRRPRTRRVDRLRLHLCEVRQVLGVRHQLRRWPVAAFHVRDCVRQRRGFGMDDSLLGAGDTNPVTCDGCARSGRGDRRGGSRCQYPRQPRRILFLSSGPYGGMSSGSLLYPTLGRGPFFYGVHWACSGRPSRPGRMARH